MGATRTLLHRRVGRHVSSALAGKTSPVAEWLRGVGWPHSTVLERCVTERELRSAEARWLEVFRRAGADLLNACAPGNHRSWTA